MANARSRREYLTSIRVEGYKSLREPQEIRLAPLTVIAGINSSGKSSIIQPILLLKQTLDVAYDPGPLQLDGPNVSITRVEQILSRTNMRQGQVRSFAVGLTYGATSVDLRFGKNAKGELRLLEQTTSFGDGESFTLREGMTSKDIQRTLPPEVLDQARRFVDSGPRDSSVQWGVRRDRCFLNVGMSLGRPVGPTGPDYFLTVAGVGEDTDEHLARIIHLPALRGNPARTYRTVAVEDRFPGTFNTYTAGVISAWQNRSRTDELNRLRADLEQLGLTWKVEARQLDDTRVELLVGRLPHARQGGAGDLVNISDVGFGVSQTLPVLVALIVAQPGQIVYLEQPEIHLHPRAQLLFAELLRRALASGVQVILETHSSLLIRGIQTLVAQGDLAGREVILHWFTRNAVSGNTQIAAGRLDNDGSFGDWPEDFDDVYLESEARYLDASAKRRKKGAR